MNTITMSAIIVTLFLGGPQPPFAFLRNIPGPQWLYGVVWFFAKLFIFLFMYVWFRATLPRMRYDQLMDLGWKLLIPVALAWLLLLASLQLAQSKGWNFQRKAGLVAADLVVAGLCVALLLRAQTVSAKRREIEGSAF
jgi:NADH-quinone oxidoreductase subunit H